MVDQLVDDALVQRERFDGDARLMLSEGQLRSVASALETIAGPREPH